MPTESKKSVTLFIGRLFLELIVVFTGVYLAFFLSNFQAEQDA